MENVEILVDKIATFFEKEENWRALKDCWLENDRSDDLRKLLRKAIEEDKIYKIVEQECSGCGKHFHLKYCSDGNYEYIDEVCDCLATFHPVDGEPSFSEWMEHIKE